MNFLLISIVFLSAVSVSAKMTVVTPSFFSDLPSNHTTKSTIPTTHRTTIPTTHRTTIPTTAIPTPTIPTTTMPPPSPPSCYYVNSTNGVCLLFMTKIKINIGNTHLENSTHSFEVDKVDSFDGHCGTDDENIKLHFWKDWTVELKVVRMNNASYKVSLVELKYNLSNTPTPVNIIHSGSASVKNLTDYSNNYGKMYVCRSGLRLNDSIPQWNYTLTAFLDDFKLEAFRVNATSIQFDANGVRSCEADQFYNNLIPIIVGSVLVLLILVVLIAYLISRRSRRSGYESV